MKRRLCMIEDGFHYRHDTPGVPDILQKRNDLIEHNNSMARNVPSFCLDFSNEHDTSRGFK
jgi:hypothetical protein